MSVESVLKTLSDEDYRFVDIFDQIPADCSAETSLNRRPGRQVFLELFPEANTGTAGEHHTARFERGRIGLFLPPRHQTVVLVQ